MKEQKNAWVTGSSRGIGRAIAERLARDGYQVAIHGRSRENLKTSGEGDGLYEVATELSAKYNVRVIAVCGELTSEAETTRCAAEIRSALGEIDILVCNAGGANLTAALDHNAGAETADEFPLELFQKRFDLNLLPTILCCREVVPAMKTQRFGRIVTIGSISGCGGNKTGGSFFPYSMAKNAIHHYTRLLAARLRPYGIPVNCVIPGNIDTPSTHIRFHYDELKQDHLSRLEKLGRPEDIANLTAFLCGEGGEYISGQAIRVDGGEQLSPC